MGTYRKHQNDCMLPYDQSFRGLCEQNLQDTLQLKQRFLDPKVKRVSKTKDKKQDGGIQSSVHVQQKFLKRSGDDLDSGNPNNIDNFEPPVKLQCTTQQHGSSQQNEGLTKFSVEIVQQLEFTTSTANSQPQQISTNVTVKTHANASVKSDISSPKAAPTPSSGSSQQQQQQQQKTNIGLDVGTLVECVKQEPDNDFADLDQCAAALEKDAAANGGAGFGASFPDLMGDDTNDEIMSSAAFKDLISDISNYPDYPELMKDFDFEDKPNNDNGSNNHHLKVEEKDVQQHRQQGQGNNHDHNIKNTQNSLMGNQNNNFSSPVFDKNPVQAVNARLPYSNMDFAKTELSPAAQTLKQMAEQHQHKNQMGINFNPNSRVPNARSPYSDFQFQGDYGSPNNSNQSFHKNNAGFPQPDLIKQEMIYQGNEFNDMKRKTTNLASGVYNKQQQYSPYGSPGTGGSPGYLNSGRGSCPPPNTGQFGGGTPPRPPSGPGNNNANNSQNNSSGGGTTSVQINQAQQLNISQHHGPIQVSAGQHLQLSADVKGNVSIAAHQGMHFTHNSNSGESHNSTNNNNNQHSPMSSGGGPQQQQGSQMSNNANTLNQNSQMGPQMGGGQQTSSSGGLGGIQNSGSAMGGQPGMQNSSGIQQQQGGLGGIMGAPPNNMPHGNNNNMMGGGGGHNNMDSYSMSQTQTINFTQQNIRRANNNGPVGMNNPGIPQMCGRILPNNNQTMEQQKLLMYRQAAMQQQQHQQQQQQQQQQHQQLRPPPPEYKANAGISQGMNPRYGGGGHAAIPNMRRIPSQPIPPSGPMIRSNMYNMLPHQQQQQQQQPQQIPGRAIYSRQPNPLAAAMESSSMHQQQQNNAEWRQALLMSQQQNVNFNTMRPNFQGNGGFNMNMGGGGGGGSIQQMTALQHQQQLRAQQAAAAAAAAANMGGPGNMGHMMGGQMNSMNAMLHMQQQQNMMQQQNSQMSMANIHMQQSQSITVNNNNNNNQNMHQSSAVAPPQSANNNGMIQQGSNNNGNNSANALANFNTQSTDFNFEFLDNLTGPTDSAPFTDQELLNSFDTDAAFDLDF